MQKSLCYNNKLELQKSIVNLDIESDLIVNMQDQFDYEYHSFINEYPEQHETESKFQNIIKNKYQKFYSKQILFQTKIDQSLLINQTPDDYLQVLVMAFKNQEKTVVLDILDYFKVSFLTLDQNKIHLLLQIYLLQIIIIDRQRLINSQNNYQMKQIITDDDEINQEQKSDLINLKLIFDKMKIKETEYEDSLWNQTIISILGNIVLLKFDQKYFSNDEIKILLAQSIRRPIYDQDLIEEEITIVDKKIQKQIESSNDQPFILSKAQQRTYFPDAIDQKQHQDIVIELIKMVNNSHELFKERESFNSNLQKKFYEQISAQKDFQLAKIIESNQYQNQSIFWYLFSLNLKQLIQDEKVKLLINLKCFSSQNKEFKEMRGVSRNQKIFQDNSYVRDIQSKIPSFNNTNIDFSIKIRYVAQLIESLLEYTDKNLQNIQKILDNILSSKFQKFDISIEDLKFGKIIIQICQYINNYQNEDIILQNDELFQELDCYQTLSDVQQSKMYLQPNMQNNLLKIIIQNQLKNLNKIFKINLIIFSFLLFFPTNNHYHHSPKQQFRQLLKQIPNLDSIWIVNDEIDENNNIKSQIYSEYPEITIETKSDQIELVNQYNSISLTFNNKLIENFSTNFDIDFDHHHKQDDKLIYEKYIEQLNENKIINSKIENSSNDMISQRTGNESAQKVDLNFKQDLSKQIIKFQFDLIEEYSIQSRNQFTNDKFNLLVEWISIQKLDSNIIKYIIDFIHGLTCQLRYGFLLMSLLQLIVNFNKMIRSSTINNYLVSNLRIILGLFVYLILVSSKFLIDKKTKTLKGDIFQSSIYAIMIDGLVGDLTVQTQLRQVISPVIRMDGFWDIQIQILHNQYQDISGLTFKFNDPIIASRYVYQFYYGQFFYELLLSDLKSNCLISFLQFIFFFVIRSLCGSFGQFVYNFNNLFDGKQCKKEYEINQTCPEFTNQQNTSNKVKLFQNTLMLILLSVSLLIYFMFLAWEVFMKDYYIKRQNKELQYLLIKNMNQTLSEYENSQNILLVKKLK